MIRRFPLCVCVCVCVSLPFARCCGGAESYYYVPDAAELGRALILSPPFHHRAATALTIDFYRVLPGFDLGALRLTVSQWLFLLISQRLSSNLELFLGVLLVFQLIIHDYLSFVF